MLALVPSPRGRSRIEPRGRSQAPGETVVKLLQMARSGKAKREMWEETATKLMVEGTLKRGALLALISADVLRDVGYGAGELIACGFTLPVLREGG